MCASTHVEGDINRLLWIGQPEFAGISRSYVLGLRLNRPDQTTQFAVSWAAHSIRCHKIY